MRLLGKTFADFSPAVIFRRFAPRVMSRRWRRLPPVAGLDLAESQLRASPAEHRAIINPLATRGPNDLDVSQLLDRQPVVLVILKRRAEDVETALANSRNAADRNSRAVVADLKVILSRRLGLRFDKVSAEVTQNP